MKRPQLRAKAGAIINADMYLTVRIRHRTGNLLPKPSFQNAKALCAVEPSRGSFSIGIMHHPIRGWNAAVRDRFKRAAFLLLSRRERPRRSGLAETPEPSTRPPPQRWTEIIISARVSRDETAPMSQSASAHLSRRALLPQPVAGERELTRSVLLQPTKHSQVVWLRTKEDRSEGGPQSFGPSSRRLRAEANFPGPTVTSAQADNMPHGRRVCDWAIGLPRICRISVDPQSKPAGQLDELTNGVRARATLTFSQRLDGLDPRGGHS